MSTNRKRKLSPNAVAMDADYIMTVANPVKRNTLAIQKWCNDHNFHNKVNIGQIIEFSGLNHDEIVVCGLWFSQMVLKASGQIDYDCLVDFLGEIEELYQENAPYFENFVPESVDADIGCDLPFQKMFNLNLMTVPPTDYTCVSESILAEFFSVVSHSKFVELIQAVNVLHSFATRPSNRGDGSTTPYELLSLLPTHLHKAKLSAVNIIDMVGVILKLHEVNGISLVGCNNVNDADVKLFSTLADRIIDPFIEHHTLLQNYLE